MIGITVHTDVWEIMPPAETEAQCLRNLRDAVSRGAAECDIAVYVKHDPRNGEIVYSIKMLSAYDDGKLEALARSCIELSRGKEISEGLAREYGEV